MAAQPSSLTPRTIRVYCPTHKINFDVAANASIECSSGTHTLARDFPVESFWEYCCDCQHYRPIDASGKGGDECPVCERKLVRRSLCAECKVISVESDQAGRRKAFSISAQGTVSPTCPGCLRRSNRQSFEHQCEDFAHFFFTTRKTCPFCDKPLEPPPAFPCSVAAYLDKLPQSAITVGFNPESGLVQESPSGACYSVPVARDSALSLVIPKFAALNSKQDYYTWYYELFNCENPAVGEMTINSPAIVEAVEGGWQVREAGFIEIKPAPQAAVNDEAKRMCAACGTEASAGHAFCKRCGARLAGQTSEPGIQSTVPGPEPAAQYDPDPTPPLPQPQYQASGQNAQSSGLQPKTILSVLGGIAGLAIIIAIIALVSNNNSTRALEQKLDSAITRQQLFTPTTGNAHDLYYQLKNSGASEETLRSYREKLVPSLTQPAYQMISAFMVPGSDDPPMTDWQTAYQSLRWASELKPEDKGLVARTAYCEGRLAFLSKDEDRAIEAWTRASRADKSWPLPVNGIGLIYTARKNYPAARTHYFDAVQRDPNWAYPYNNIGTSYFMERNYYEAKGYYQKAAQLAPKWARPHSWLGDIAMKEGDYVTAIQEFSLVFEPGATGTKNMDLDKIQKQLDLARQRSQFQY
jgi:tetratricopeptide (TPR) repeat protein